MNVVVTGAAGFVGQYLCNYLRCAFRCAPEFSKRGKVRNYAKNKPSYGVLTATKACAGGYARFYSVNV